MPERLKSSSSYRQKKARINLKYLGLMIFLLWFIKRMVNSIKFDFSEPFGVLTFCYGWRTDKSFAIISKMNNLHYLQSD